jgi:hypothetical protein
LGKRGRKSGYGGHRKTASFAPRHRLGANNLRRGAKGSGGRDAVWRRFNDPGTVWRGPFRAKRGHLRFSVDVPEPLPLFSDLVVLWKYKRSSSLAVLWTSTHSLAISSRCVQSKPVIGLRRFVVQCQCEVREEQEQTVLLLLVIIAPFYYHPT